MFDATQLYNYKAIVTSVYDGDTITVDIDLGMGIWNRGEKIRLYGIDTPEVRGPERPEGLVSRDYLRDLILDKEIVLTSYKDKKGKYGRYLGTIWFKNAANEWFNVNEQLVSEGLAEFKNY